LVLDFHQRAQFFASVLYMRFIDIIVFTFQL
jgi:hypothetical protein